MTYETRNIAFHVIHVKVSSDSRCSRNLPMEREREREREREIIVG